MEVPCVRGVGVNSRVRIDAVFRIWALVVAISASLLADSNASARLLQDLHSHDLLKRYAAARTALQKPEYLSDRSIQQAFVTLLIRESNDPKWEGKEEFMGYEQYYECLSDAVQRIATRFHDPRAWSALLHTNFDDSSRFADWITSEPEAFPFS